MKKIGLLFACALMPYYSVWAAGLAVPTQGSAALGMSLAMTARSEDLSAIYYNPPELIILNQMKYILVSHRLRHIVNFRETEVPPKPKQKHFKFPRFMQHGGLQIRLLPVSGCMLRSVLVLTGMTTGTADIHRQKAKCRRYI